MTYQEHRERREWVFPLHPSSEPALPCRASAPGSVAGKHLLLYAQWVLLRPVEIQLWEKGGFPPRTNSTMNLVKLK